MNNSFGAEGLVYLGYRFETKQSDFDSWFNFVSDRLGYADSRRRDFIGLWRHLIEVKSAIHITMEDRDQTDGQQVVPFGIGTFASEEFAEQAKGKFGPFIQDHMLAEWQAGRKFWLGPDEIRAVQTREGATFVSVHCGIDQRRYKREDEPKIGEYMSRTFLGELAKFKIKEYLEEVYGDIEYQRFVNFGFWTLRDYSEVSENKNGRNNRAYLMGTVLKQYRKEGDRLESLVGRMALTGPPRFGFRAGDQEVLRLAIKDRTDEDIAAELALSLPAIKKRWQAIYDRIDAVDAAMFDPEDGGQRRRRVVAMIREHPEELWPSGE